MTARTKTPWFSVTTPPVRDGVYETRLAALYGGYCEITRRVFKGGEWFMVPFHGRSIMGYDPRDQWRGLTEKS